MSRRAMEALDRLEKIAGIIDNLAYAVGCGLEGTRTAKNIREAVGTVRAALPKPDIVERARSQYDAMGGLLRHTGPLFAFDVHGEPIQRPLPAGTTRPDSRPCVCGHSAAAHGDEPSRCFAGDRGQWGVQPCTCHEYRVAPERLERRSDCEFCAGTGTDHTDPSLGRCPYCTGGRVALTESAMSQTEPREQPLPHPLPCPFCGGDEIWISLPNCRADTLYERGDRLHPIASCYGCGAVVPGDDEDYGGDTAREAWNTRVAPEQSTGVKAGPESPAPEVGAPTGAVEAPRAGMAEAMETRLFALLEEAVDMGQWYRVHTTTMEALRALPAWQPGPPVQQEEG